MYISVKINDIISFCFVKKSLLAFQLLVTTQPYVRGANPTYLVCNLYRVVPVGVLSQIVHELSPQTHIHYYG